MNRFSDNTASLSFKRSSFDLSHKHLMHAFHGDLCKAEIMEVLPGDTWKWRNNVLTRMSTPIAPIMDNIKQYYAAFFVPKRIIWDKTKQFYGEAENFGIASEVTEPMIKSAALSISTENALKPQYIRSIATNFGLIRMQKSLTYSQATPLNILPIRAYLACYNEHFRDQNYQPKYMWDKNQSGVIGDSPIATLNGVSINGLSPLPQVNKNKDLFTSILPWAQKGDPVTLPLGDKAPLVTGTSYDTDANILFHSDTNGTVGIFQGDIGVKTPSLGDTPSGSLTGTNLYADLSNATAATINQLIYATAYQDFLNKLGKFGSRYQEYINAMFGVHTSDSSIDIPEFLGSTETAINVDQVLQTTGYEVGVTSKLAAPGAVSVTGSSRDLFTKSFTEPGYIVVVTYFKHDRTYAQGIDPIYLKSELLDYYQTPFANIGDVPFKLDYLYFSGAINTTNLGFQEPHWDYKFGRDHVSGVLNPCLDNSLNYWDLADNYSTAPVIGADFLKEDRNALKRALTTADNGPDYIIDQYFDITCVRTMPMFSQARLGTF